MSAARKSSLYTVAVSCPSSDDLRHVAGLRKGGAGQPLTLNFGAAGVEVDSADPDLGTPAHAVVLASSVGELCGELGDGVRKAA
jgi:hypothetical protein